MKISLSKHPKYDEHISHPTDTTHVSMDFEVDGFCDDVIMEFHNFLIACGWQHRTVIDAMAEYASGYDWELEKEEIHIDMSDDYVRMRKEMAKEIAKGSTSGELTTEEIDEMYKKLKLPLPKKKKGKK